MRVGVEDFCTEATVFVQSNIGAGQTKNQLHSCVAHEHTQADTAEIGHDAHRLEGSGVASDAACMHACIRVNHRPRHGVLRVLQCNRGLVHAITWNM